MRLVLLIGLSAATLCRAGAEEKIVVFARNDYLVVGGAPVQTSGVERRVFLDAAVRDLPAPGHLDRAIPLVNPPAWGRTVHEDTGGSLEIAQAYPHGFRFNLELHRLLPRHEYVLCINGRPNHPGNELLPQPVPRNPAEKYEDFHNVMTDDAGAYAGRYALFLRRGPYNVHFYVKDAANHKIVSYGVEYFDFAAD